MRRILLAATALLAFGAGSSQADVGDSAVIEVNALQEKVCEITASSGSVSLAGYNVAVPGTFKYKCNFIGDPTFNFQSAYGGVMTTENGGATATYGIFLNDDTPAVAGFPTPLTWLSSAGSTGGGATFFGGALGSGISSSGSPNVEVVPVFELGLTQALTVAGSYTDLLTITISP